MFILQGIDLSKLEDVLSAPRLGSYSGLLGTPGTGPALGGYFWNLELSAALSPLLGTVEVALRNAIHQAASIYFGQPDWFGVALRHAGDRQWSSMTTAIPTPPIVDNYFRPTAAVFNKKKRTVGGTQKTLKRWFSPAEGKLSEVKDRLTKHGIPNVPDQVVANAMFGFWLDLFHPSFEDSATPTALWPHCFASAFPSSSAVPDRAVMQLKLKAVKDFRNRLSHHEPVWKFGPGMTPLGAEQQLKQHLTALLEIAGAVSPALVAAFEKTGILKRIHWLCSAQTLNAFAATGPSVRVDHRKLGGAVKRALKGSLSAVAPVGGIKPSKAVSLEKNGKPLAILVPIQ